MSRDAIIESGSRARSRGLGRLGLRTVVVCGLAALSYMMLPTCAAPRLGDPARFGAPGTPSSPAKRAGDEIAVCGTLFHSGTRVVLWDEPGAYDAYSLDPRFPEWLRKTKREAPVGRRYGARRRLPAELSKRVADRGWRLPDLQQQVDQFVLHYDVCGTSRQCFKVLHDMRKLSVHFMLDVDGTIYQTLDLKERAWHGTKANDRSIGIEIAHIGAYPREKHRVLLEWYADDAKGPYVTLPKWMKETGLPKGFVGRPARKEIIAGKIQGKDLWQYDFTEEQYRALTKLIATLTTVFPRMRLDYPRDASGALVRKKLDDAVFDDYRGLLGHYHVQVNKTDPGPALDWDRLLNGAKALRDAREASLEAESLDAGSLEAGSLEAGSGSK